jgi:hypothetical protein
MREKADLVRERLSPFVESAMRQLVSEIPHSREGYNLLVRVKNLLVAACTEAWIPKKRKSRGRKRSAKDQADRDEWYSRNVRDRDEGRRRTGPSETV